MKVKTRWEDVEKNILHVSVEIPLDRLPGGEALIKEMADRVVINIPFEPYEGEKMLPGQRPYTPAEWEIKRSLLCQAVTAEEVYDTEDLEEYADRLAIAEVLIRTARDRVVKCLEEAIIGWVTAREFAELEQFLIDKLSLNKMSLAELAEQYPEYLLEKEGGGC